jgi:hypothetical protein
LFLGITVFSIPNYIKIKTWNKCVEL